MIPFLVLSVCHPDRRLVEIYVPFSSPNLVLAKGRGAGLHLAAAIKTFKLSCPPGKSQIVACCDWNKCGTAKVAHKQHIKLLAEVVALFPPNKRPKN